ncbi:long-chain acyl-CoA synthetase [Kineosphaera limosa]|uniref:Putative long-chain-fatty-acid--CoA ligase n=1 Tax=Kineosphaera limosa NBRC 100340 TaxID=1184609 RepID=K6WSQ8_9MICO|nr:long-chain fatty acid--CoA ligase [Kineosphaera limosa]NYE02767.1 long-chain acyl-CoA synthetase [Kineosphaera limosa]GAB96846.1 putative long-chain-fatty-acid--CoA ligase [Kineosphaera limosa NBRC 100340]
MTAYNLASLLEDSTRRYPERTAIVLGDTRLSYAQVNGAANQVANLLVSRGVQPGDKIALLCPNLPWFTIIYNGILKAGATVVPLNVLLKSGEIAYHLQDSDCVALFAFQGTPEMPMGREAFTAFESVDSVRDFFLITADPAAASPIEGAQTFAGALAGQPATFETVVTDEDDTAVILYTSGTTGRPKGAELRHRNMRDNALLSESLFGSDPDNPDTYLCVLPLFHSFGQTVIQNGGLANGGTIVMLPRFEPAAALAIMLNEQVTFFAGVPTMYWALLSALTEDVDVAAIAARLRTAVSGGSALPVEIHRQFEARFGVIIAEGYGLSETSPVAAFKPFGAPARPGSIGASVNGVELKLVAAGSWDEIEWTADAIGEIAVRGHNIFKGYYGRDEATAEVLTDEGWFRTGDLAKRDEDGWYYIVDRAKDLIIRGGFNVYPREIEEVLLTHEDVSLAAVIGVPHPSHGEEVKAVVVLKPNATVSAAELVAWGKEQMASYKYPRTIQVVESMPMTATGKILKRELSATEGQA